ncbi:MAG: damage-inducible protein CinA, partial [Coriobacteriaceae bacterium]|nr:damage-inducible protein CinA [Coriobacteriaceae bacterium]
ELKISLLDVPPGLLARYGAVSEQAARAMAEGAVAGLGADAAVAVTGIAGPDGATPERPLGLVWFGLAGPWGSIGEERTFPGDRERVRLRATATALDLLRRRLGSL